MIKPSPLDLAHRRKVGPVSWHQFKAEITPDFSVPRCTKGHAGRWRQVCRILEGLGVECTSDLNLAMVDAFIESRPPGQSKFSLQALLVMVRTICSKAVHYRYLDVSPFAIKPVSKFVRLGKPRGQRHLSLLECRALLATLAREKAEAPVGWLRWKALRLEIAANIALYTGLRKNELLRLQVQDIDLPARLIRLTPHNETGEFKTAASEDSVPIPEAIVPLIDEWMRLHRLARPRGFTLPDPEPVWLIPTCSRRGPWVSGYLDSKPLAQLRAAGQRAGINHRITWHALRRSLATALEAKGVGGEMITRVLRHTSRQTTETYYQRRDEANMVDALKDLTF